MTIVLHVKLELEKFDTDYSNLDDGVMTIVNHEWDENQFEITVDNELISHEINMDETFYYIKEGTPLLSTSILMFYTTDDLDKFDRKIKINDFMINSYLDDKIFDVKIINANINDTYVLGIDE